MSLTPPEHFTIAIKLVCQQHINANWTDEIICLKSLLGMQKGTTPLTM